MEPIEKLNQPTHKEIRRLTFYFEGGTAQDYIIDPEDTIEVHGECYIIRRKGDKIVETVWINKVCHQRDARMMVKIQQREKILS